MDETISGEPMASKVINKINGKLKFLYRKNSFLTPSKNAMPSYNHILIMHAPRGTLTLT